MDSTRAPLGVMTMVYEDYAILERWYAYYRAQVGAENLFVFSHGGDPEHRRIAADANVIAIPRDPGMVKFDRRRWRMMGRVASGLLDFYNWMIVADVDEIMIVDPDVSDRLVDHIAATYGVPGAPRNICPFALELIHVPEEEPEPIEPGATVLSRRRYFRPNWNYSKPCLISAPTIWGPGGHRNDLGPRYLADDLYLLHLKYFDVATLEVRAEEKRRTIEAAGALNAAHAKGHPWMRTLEGYHGIRAGMELGGEDIKLPDFRKAMSRQKEKFHNQFVWGRAETKTLHRIPGRFSDVF